MIAEEKLASSETDVYGQIHPIETADFLELKLDELNLELDNAVDNNGAWLQAKSKCRQLVDDKFKLQFLRCEVFNVDLAARRIIKYWDERLKLFGHEKAFLPLTQSGALRDDKTALGMVFFRLTGTTDVSGRRIVFADPSQLDSTKYSRESMARAVWYVMHAALEDEITQQKGVIFVVYPHNAKLSQFDRKLAMMNMSAMQGRLPVRLSAFHIVRPPSFFSMVFAVIRLFMHDHVRKRVVIHSGSEKYALESLTKKGLSPEVLPVEIGGNVLINQRQWLHSRRQQESP